MGDAAPNCWSVVVNIYAQAGLTTISHCQQNNWMSMRAQTLTHHSNLLAPLYPLQQSTSDDSLRHANTGQNVLCVHIHKMASVNSSVTRSLSAALAAAATVTLSSDQVCCRQCGWLCNANVSVCRSVCSHFLCTKYLQNVWTDFDEILWKGGTWRREQSIRLWWRSGFFHGSWVIF